MGTTQENDGRARPRRHGIGTKLAVSLGTLALLVLAFEAVHRYRYYGLAGFSPRLLASVRTVGDAGMVRASEHPGIVYELRPNLDVIFKLTPFRTNSRGMRDEEFDPEKPPGTFRIAAVGDSFTMGSGVSRDEIYHSVLERSLDARYPDRHIEVLNFGVGGYGLTDYVAVLEEKVFEFDPDLILIGLVINDARPPDATHTKENFRERPPLERSFLRLVSLEHLVDEVTPPEHDGPGGGHAEARAYRFESFERLARAARGRPVVCVYLATSRNERDERNVRRFGRLSRKHGFGFVDTTQLFDGPDSLPYQIFPNDQHPNARAHAMYAELIEEYLTEGGWLSP